jgi:hypothetical protein
MHAEHAAAVVAMVSTVVAATRSIWHQRKPSKTSKLGILLVCGRCRPTVRKCASESTLGESEPYVCANAKLQQLHAWWTA